MAKTDLMYGWAELTKSHEMPDGSVIVEGRLGGPTEDLDGQYLDKDWLDVAVPKWAQRGNIRAMHQPISAGVAKSVEDRGDDWHLVAKINDPVEVKKVLDGNYTGFSVGVKNGGTLKTGKTAANGRALEAINKGTIVEVSLADFPCDPKNFLSLVDKAVALDDEDLEAIAAKAVEPETEPVVDEPTATEPDTTKTVVTATSTDEEPEITVAGLLEKLAGGTLSEAETALLKAVASAVNEHLDVEKDAAHGMPGGQSASQIDAIDDTDGDNQDADGNTKTCSACRKAGCNKCGTCDTKECARRDPMNDTGTQSSNDLSGTPNVAGVGDLDGDDGQPMAAGNLGRKAATPDDTKAVVPDFAKMVEAEVAKVVTSDLLKAAVSEALKPLEEKVAAMEKMAAPGGPMVGSMRQTFGTKTAQSNLLQKRADQLSGLLQHHDPRVAAGARELLEKLATNE